jgi:hypothetical protein
MAIKYLVEVYLPAAQKRFDMRIPATSRMGEINSLVASIAADLSEGSYRATKQSILINAADGEMYDVNMTALEQGIRNGTQLILI